MEKKYTIPEELLVLVFHSMAVREVIDILVEKIATPRYAFLKRPGITMEDIVQQQSRFLDDQRKFWNGVYELYPELKGQQCTFKASEGVVYLINQKENA